MHPELFRIPFTTLTVKSYGLMLVIGFLAAVHVIRRLSRNITPDPQLITNASLYALAAGVIGARMFYVLHYIDYFRDVPLDVFKVWEGGLELLGGVIGALTVIIFYLRYHKLPARQYLDILAIGLMIALSFGRIGCVFRGCCYGKPADVPWAIRFPYNSLAYDSQVYPNTKRDRTEPQLKLPEDYFDSGVLKPFNELTPEQKEMVTMGPYRCLPVHPTQLYSSAGAAAYALVLYLFWRRSEKSQKNKTTKFLTKPGSTFALMLIFYGIGRFFIEFLRGDNPFESDWWTIYRGGTISQNIAIYMVITGVILLVIFQKLPADGAISRKNQKAS